MLTFLIAIDSSLEEHIRDTVLRSAQTYCSNFADSLSAGLLQQLANYFERLQYPSDELMPGNLRENINDIFCSLKILQQLESDRALKQQASIPTMTGKKKTRAKKPRTNSSKDEISQPFRILGLDVPKSSEESTALSQKLLQRLRDYLNVRLLLSMPLEFISQY